MDKVKRSIRLPLQVANAIQKQAELRGVSQYAMLEMCVHQGISKIANEDNSGTILNEIATQIGALNARINYLERLQIRNLFVGVSAYSFSVVAASSHKIPENEMALQIDKKFQNQLRLAGGFDEQQ